MTRRKARVEGSAASAIPDDPNPAFALFELANQLEAAVEAYKAKFDDWGDIRTWPTESGIAHMIEKLKA